MNINLAFSPPAAVGRDFVSLASGRSFGGLVLSRVGGSTAVGESVRCFMIASIVQEDDTLNLLNREANSQLCTFVWACAHAFDEFSNICWRLREEIDAVSMTTDILVGFDMRGNPSEL